MYSMILRYNIMSRATIELYILFYQKVLLPAKFISISINAEKIVIETSINEWKIFKFEHALDPPIKQIERLVNERIPLKLLHW